MAIFFALLEGHIVSSCSAFLLMYSHTDESVTIFIVNVETPLYGLQRYEILSRYFAGDI